MLEQLFGSKTRVMLLRLFLNNPEKFYFVRELTRSLETHLNSIRRELSNLESIGIIDFHSKTDLSKEAGKEIKDNKKGRIFLDSAFLLQSAKTIFSLISYKQKKSHNTLTACCEINSFKSVRFLKEI